MVILVPGSKELKSATSTTRVIHHLHSKLRFHTLHLISSIHCRHRWYDDIEDGLRFIADSSMYSLAIFVRTNIVIAPFRGCGDSSR